MLWDCFSAAGTAGMSEYKKSSMHLNIEIALIKIQSRAFRSSDGAEGLPSNRTVTLSTQQEWFIDNNWD